MLLCLLAAGVFLVDCSSKEQAKSPDQTDISNTPDDEQNFDSSSQDEGANRDKFNENRHPTDLPKDADSANTDKIYATDGSEIYYESSSSGFAASTPDFKGYTANKVKQILGSPSSIIKDTKTMKSMLTEDEQERIISLFKTELISREEAKAFYSVANDFVLGNLDRYYIYEYKDKNIVLLFNTESDTLAYITPNPDYVYWR
ncbi:DUF4947 domain-containing protein [Streptococcus dentapri]|uniref:DUF4947 domain-containing protein n=1 Tax=Streptococcus dentapri TaxID=573564 RepID=A0ABV8D2G2_9STRE